MLLLAVIISLLGLVEAEPRIAFDTVSCTPEVLPFVQTEMRNALEVVLLTELWLHPPLYNEVIQSYVENLFGPGDSISSPRSVFLNLLQYNTEFVEASELSNSNGQ